MVANHVTDDLHASCHSHVGLYTEFSPCLDPPSQLGWDSTIITGVSVTHVVEQSAMDVPTKQWDSTVAWFIQNYAGLYPLSFIVDNVIHTPVTSLVSLVNAAAVAKPGWFLLSGDVQAHIPL
jgi:hypothetical protein